MSEFPQVPKSHAQERRGVAAVQAYAAEHGQIWRETDRTDVGIDGQLEFVDPAGSATGRMLAVQIKTGPSYFGSPTECGCKFYPEAKHRLYWERYPIPVLLVVHDPEKAQSYWVDIRQALRTPQPVPAAYVEVPGANVLQFTPPASLFQNAGAQDEAFVPDLWIVAVAVTRPDAPIPAMHEKFSALVPGDIASPINGLLLG